MAINSFVINDYLGIARSRVTEQFKDKPVFDHYLQLLLSGEVELQEVFRQLMQERSLDTAVGSNLDNIGEIVGQPRTLLSVDIFEFFGFQGVANAGSYGDFYDPNVGAVYYDANNPRFGNVTLTDDVYRIFIKAKIAKNSTHARPEEFMDFANFIFSTTGSTIQDEGNAAYTLLVGKQLSSFEQSLLNYIQKTDFYNSSLLPQPLGVKVNYGEFDINNFFAFQGVPNAKGYGEAVASFSYDGSSLYDGTASYGFVIKEGVGGQYASFIGV